jgi:hypothetical protein
MDSFSAVTATRKALRLQPPSAAFLDPADRGAAVARHRAASLYVGRPYFYATVIKGCVIQARIPMPRCVPPGNRDDDTAKETEP